MQPFSLQDQDSEMYIDTRVRRPLASQKQLHDLSEIKNPEVTKEIIDEGAILPGNFEQENVQKESGAVKNKDIN